MHYFKWQNCLRQSPCHGMVLAVPRPRWMMYICFPVRQKADFVFKLSTEEQEGFKTCVVMVQALQKCLCNHHLTVEILSAAAALLHGACHHHSLPELCYPQARAQLWILVGWLKHVTSPHKTRVCDFIFLPSSEQLLNNSLGGKKNARVSYRHLRTMQCSFGEPWKPSPCAAPRVKQAGDWVQALVGSLQTTPRNGGSGWKTRLKIQSCSELAEGERGVKPSAVSQTQSETLCSCLSWALLLWELCKDLNSLFWFSTNRSRRCSFKSSLVWVPASLLDAMEGCTEMSSAAWA